MSGWAAKVSLEKKMKAESAASYRLAEDLKKKAERDGYVTAPVERKERAATAEKREREFVYGKDYRPEWGISECCSMILSATGVCSGCGETPWYVEMINDAEVCEIGDPTPREKIKVNLYIHV